MQLQTPQWTDGQRRALQDGGDRQLSAAGLTITITASGELHVEIPLELQQQIVTSAVGWVEEKCPGHGNREPGRSWDPGAVFGVQQERRLAGRVADLAAPILRRAGNEVTVFDGPGYSAEHDEILRWMGGRRGLYLSLHWNIGGATYALCRPDYRSQAGRRAAAAIGDALEDLPEVSRFTIDELYPSSDAAAEHKRQPTWTRTGPDWGWWTRGWVCISGLWAAPRACGVLVELGFLDSSAHAPLTTDEGLARVAERLAAGVEAFRTTPG